VRPLPGELGGPGERKLLTSGGGGGTMDIGGETSSRNLLTDTEGGGIMRPSGINSPIETPHPADVLMGGKELNTRQQALLDALPAYGSETVVGKKQASMLDLAALTAKTGVEFSMFTRKGERMILRGGKANAPFAPDDAVNLRKEGYRWSGHTHSGYGLVDLEPSQGDSDVLSAFGQKKSLIYNAAGRHRVFEVFEK
jgi:hypothetical protein